MISKAEINKRIVFRAYAQFNRDINLIKELINNSGGSISVYDVMDKVQEGEKKDLMELKFSKIPILNKFFKQEQEEGYQIYDFLLRFMSDLEMLTLSVDDFKSINLQETYLKRYKKEYEDFQTFLFNTKDMRLYNSQRRIIRCGNEEEGDAENY